MGKAAIRGHGDFIMKLAFRTICCVLLALVLAACHGSTDSSRGTGAVELKLYRVPVQQSATIQQALWNALAGSTAAGGAAGSNSGMRVTQPFPGTLMVLAPRSIQESVGSVIAGLDKAVVEIAPPERLQVHFWVITAWADRSQGGTMTAHSARAGAIATEHSAEQAHDNPALKSLAGLLDEIRASLGPSQFRLDASVSGTTTPGEMGDINTGDHRRFNFTARRANDGAIDLQVNYGDGQNRGIAQVHATVAMTPGQYVVLAQAPGNEPLVPPGQAALVLLVARVDRTAPASH